MMLSHDIIKSLLRTEKSTLGEASGKYMFLVSKDANKIQIKRAVEEIYKVKVTGVNTSVRFGKLKRVRHQIGRAVDRKLAIVSLKEGQKIETA